MKPLSGYYEAEVRKWLRCNPGKVVTLRHISTLFGFIEDASMKTAINGFGKTGIWPPDHNVFTDADYLQSATTVVSINSSTTAKAGKGSTEQSSRQAPQETFDCSPKPRTIGESTPPHTSGNLNYAEQPHCSGIPDFDIESHSSKKNTGCSKILNELLAKREKRYSVFNIIQRETRSSNSKEIRVA